MDNIVLLTSLQQPLSFSVEWLCNILYFSHSVRYKWFWVKLCVQYQWVSRTWTFQCTHTRPSLADLYSYTSSEALPCRRLYTVSQTSAARFLSVWQGKEVEWKKCSPAHCGHMAREESSRSGARRPQSGIFVVGFLLAAVWGALQPGSSALCCSLPALSLTHLNPKIGYKNNQRRCTFSSLIMSPSFFLSQTIYTDGVDTWKGITPLQEWRERIGLHQQSGSPLPNTLWPEWMTSIYWLPLTKTHTHTHTVKPGQRVTYTQKHRLYI